MTTQTGHVLGLIMTEKQRIAKVLAACSGLSRRQAEQAIYDGRVHVNHKILTTPAYTVSEKDAILLDHEPIKSLKPFVVVYHKPMGFVCSHNPQGQQKSIYDQLKKHHNPPTTFLRHIGRLDINSEGLLLLTNCPQTAHSMQNKPWNKIYKVRTQGIITQRQVQTLNHVRFLEKKPIEPMRVELLRTTQTNSWTQWTLTQGRYRQIRLSLEKIRSRASRIIRLQFGPFILGDIPSGKHVIVPDKTLHKLLNL